MIWLIVRPLTGAVDVVLVAQVDGAGDRVDQLVDGRREPLVLVGEARVDGACDRLRDAVYDGEHAQRGACGRTLAEHAEVVAQIAQVVEGEHGPHDGPASSSAVGRFGIASPTSCNISATGSLIVAVMVSPSFVDFGRSQLYR
ncbi:MAG: hypothetical protein H0W46_09965 [Acidimicrobiia bacterium]|nr:hypothetical protein [Acidimicrobiia bacterium]